MQISVIRRQVHLSADRQDPAGAENRWYVSGDGFEL